MINYFYTPLMFNMPGSLNVSVSSTAGTPTGNVSMAIDNNPAVSQALVNGSTVFAIPLLSVGTHTVVVSYAAQGIFGGTSANGPLVVNPAITSINFSTSPMSFNSNGSVAVTVASAAGTPPGNVSLTVDNGAPLSQSLLNGATTFTLAPLPVGSRTVTAQLHCARQLCAQLSHRAAGSHAGGHGD